MNDLLHAWRDDAELLAGGLASRTYWPDILTSDLVVRLADGRVESVGESRSLFTVLGARACRRPIPQYEIKDRSGRVIARVDFAWPELRRLHGVRRQGEVREFLRPGESVRTDAVLREKRRERA